MEMNPLSLDSLAKIFSPSVGCLAASIFGFPQPMVFLIVLMVITDSVEYGQLKLGNRDESLALSVRPLIDKFGGAVANLFFMV